MSNVITIVAEQCWSCKGTGKEQDGAPCYICKGQKVTRKVVPRIACIGRRDPTDTLRTVMVHTGQYLVRHGYTISTGNAKGADSLFAIGGNRVNPAMVELHLPWPGYNQELVMPDNIISVDGGLLQHHLIASQYHPNWAKLGRGVQALHARNVAIIQGTVLVIAVPNHAKPGGGGTGMGMRIATHFGILCLDLTKPEDLKRITDKLQGEI
jgi:hypothetical protein